jgi:lipopolysaccharide export system protein LptC
LANRTIILILLILASGIAISWVIDVSDRPPDTNQTDRNEPDLFMYKPEISQFNENGRIQHRIEAERLTHFPMTDVTTLKSPNIILFSEPGTPTWDIAAENGRMLPKAQLRDETLELWDGVLAVRDEGQRNFVNIRTESLVVYPEKDFAETDQRVKVDIASGQTSAGGGMKAFLEEGRYEFFSSKQERVNTVVIPPAADDNPDGS